MEKTEEGQLYPQHIDCSSSEGTSLFPASGSEWPSSAPATSSIVSHTRGADPCEDRPGADPATAEIPFPTPYKVARIFYAVSHNAVVASLLTLSV